MCLIARDPTATAVSAHGHRLQPYLARYSSQQPALQWAAEIDDEQHMPAHILEAAAGLLRADAGRQPISATEAAHHQRNRASCPHAE